MMVVYIYIFSYPSKNNYNIALAHTLTIYKLKINAIKTKYTLASFSTIT